MPEVRYTSTASSLPTDAESMMHHKAMRISMLKNNMAAAPLSHIIRRQLCCTSGTVQYGREHPLDKLCVFDQQIFWSFPADDSHNVQVSMYTERNHSVRSDLTHIGGLPMLLALLESQYAPLRASAAEVVATCVQSNTPVQQFFLDGGTLPKLLKLTEDAEPAVR